MGAVLHLAHTWGHPSETFVRALVEGVPGWEPAVVVEHVAGPAPAHLPIRRVGPLLDHLPNGVAGKAAVLAAVAHGRRHRAALVHAHMDHELLLARRAAQVLRRPLVVSLHGRDLLVHLDRDPAGLGAVRGAAAVIVPSPFLADAAIARGVAPDRLAVIPSGVDPAAIPFRPRSPVDEPLVLFVGRFVEKKGVLLAARAVAEVAADHPLRARFVGTGPLEDELRAALRGLGGRAEVVDGRDRSNVRRGLAEADLLVSPSVTAPDGDAETLLLVNVEAQAAGLPVLTTDHGGTASGLGPGAAVVVPEGDLRALTAGLRHLIAHPERWAAMGQRGRAHVEAHLTQEITTERTAQVYAAVASGRPVPPELRPSAGSPAAGPN